jgi:hypothetical protein
MLDVHAPHATVHGWRDFLTHIATITIGLLIALALEAGVENLHHRHIVREARENIREEVRENQQLLAFDLKYLDSNSNTLRQDIALLTQLKEHPKQLPDPKLNFPWGWNSPSAAAWDTARNTGALTLMSYDNAHAFSLTYAQQSYVNEQATLYINHHHAAMIPLEVNPDVSTLSPTQLDEMIHGCATTLSDIQYLEELMKGLNTNYTNLLSQL